MTRFASYIRRNPVISFFVVVVVVSFIVHAWNRNDHFQECDSSLVYGSLYDFPRSQLSFNANTYPQNSFISRSTAENIVSNPLVKEIIGRYAKDFSTEEIVRRLTEVGPVPLFRFALVSAIERINPPHAIKSFFAVPLGSTYSAGAGLAYGLVSGFQTTYEDFMSHATLLTLALFHVGVLLIFFAAIGFGIDGYTALLAGLCMLFSVSLYSYGYHLGSTVWNFSTGALWIWFLVRNAKKPAFLRTMSYVTGILIFFNYLIVFYWVALIGVYLHTELKSGENFKERARKTFGVLKTQIVAIISFAIVAVLFYPPGQSGGGLELQNIISNFYFIILNFYSIFTHSRMVDAIQFLAGLAVTVFGFISLIGEKTEIIRNRKIVSKTFLLFFTLFVLASVVGVLGFIPDRHILFLAPAIFFVAAVGIGYGIEKFKPRVNILRFAALSILIAGSLGLYSRISDVKDRIAELSVDPDVSAIVVEDCGWSFIYGNWHGKVPAYHIEAGVLESGKTYLYISQSRGFDVALARWKKDYAFDIEVQTFEERTDARNVYFLAYNPRHSAENRPNSIYETKFRVLKLVRKN